MELAVGAGYNPTQGISASIIKTIIDILREGEKAHKNYNIHSGLLADKITPKGQPSTSKEARGKTSFITISSEIWATICHLIDMFYTESFMSIVRLDYVLNDTERLLSLTKELKEALQTVDPKAKNMLTKWIRLMRGYKARRNLNIEFADIDPDEFLDIVEQSSNRSRILNRIGVIEKEMKKIASRESRTAKLTLKTIDDVILLKQVDFEYPHGGSFIEYFSTRMKRGRGHKQLLVHNSPNSIREAVKKIYADHRQTLQENYKTKILEALKEDNIIDRINLTPSFLDEMGDLLINLHVDLAVSFYNYVRGATNRVSTTTINLQALRIIFSLDNLGSYTGLIMDHYIWLGDIVPGFIQARKEQRKSKKKD
jgi:hypothetical protein